MSKEVIEKVIKLLEENPEKNIINNSCFACREYREIVIQALAILRAEELTCPNCGLKGEAAKLPHTCKTKELKCKTCGESKTVVNPTFGPDDPSQPPYLACPDCKPEEPTQPTADKPETGEFTKRFRDFIKLSEEHLSKNKIGRLRTYSREACDRLDSQAAELKDLSDTVQINCNPPEDCNDPVVLKGGIKMLKRQKGNMYEFVTHMWAPIRGRCSHDCSYCYMKRWGEQPPLHLDEKDLNTNLGSGKFIFVCHTCDMFAKDVPDIWIKRVLEKCTSYDNRYLFQSKNPQRFIDYVDWFPSKSIIGTTIETNRDIVKSNAPSAKKRAVALRIVSEYHWPTMVTIEPIFDFDVDELVNLVVEARPDWVNIGADSKGHGLPEPPPDKVKRLIQKLQKTTNVKLKGNLRRVTK